MATTLSQYPGEVFVTDGGLETTLVFHEGLDLPDFAAFPLLDTPEGRAALTRYYEPYLSIARRDGCGIVLDTPTWRANPDWGARLGYDADLLSAVNRRAVEFVRQLAAGVAGPVIVNGVIGPRGDGYVVGELMSAEEATSYHGLQARAFADAGVDLITAVTMTYADEAIGVAQAAAVVDVAASISFTVETDGRLPSGQPLGDAIETVDEATDEGPVHHMINCAHPSHFDHVLVPGAAWLRRVKAVRANASRMSHDELDNADELDRGDPEELAADYVKLGELLPELQIVGGCCGTDHEHVGEISRAVRR